MLRKFGYKATFILGLTLYGIGALLFWPAAMKRSFGVRSFLSLSSLFCVRSRWLTLAGWGVGILRRDFYHRVWSWKSRGCGQPISRRYANCASTYSRPSLIIRALIVCGPPRYSEMRLNFAQAVQAIGVVVGPLLASHVFFKNIKDNSLSSAQ